MLGGGHWEEGLGSCWKESAGAHGISLASGVATCSGWASGLCVFMGRATEIRFISAEDVSHGLEAGVAPSVQCWPCNHENLSLIPRAGEQEQASAARVSGTGL